MTAKSHDPHPRGTRVRDKDGDVTPSGAEMSAYDDDQDRTGRMLAGVLGTAALLWPAGALAVWWATR